MMERPLLQIAELHRQNSLMPLTNWLTQSGYASHGSFASALSSFCRVRIRIGHKKRLLSLSCWLTNWNCCRFLSGVPVKIRRNRARVS